MESIPAGPACCVPDAPGELLAKAQREFDDLSEKTVAALLSSPAVLSAARNGQQWAVWKLEEIDQAIALCAGLRTEAQADAAACARRHREDFFTALNCSALAITLAGVHLSGWGMRMRRKTSLEYNKPDVTAVPMVISEAALLAAFLA